jgi:hypothetical protein
MLRQAKESNLNVPRRLAAQISEAPNQYRNYYVPVFKVSCDETPYHAGTAFGIEHHGTRYLVTAAHVLEKDNDNPCDAENELFVFVNGVFTQMRLFDTHFVRSPNRSMPLDLALISPKEFDVSAVVTKTFSNAQCFRSRLHQSLYVVACGFPGTKNSAKRSVRVLTRRPVGYFGRISHPAKLRKAGFDPHTHFSFDILLKKTFSGSRREIKAPKPHGISGGPVFVVHDFARSKQMAAKLRGVVIENAWKHQCIVCVDLFSVLSSIQKDRCQAGTHLAVNKSEEGTVPGLAG